MTTRYNDVAAGDVGTDNHWQRPVIKAVLPQKVPRHPILVFDQELGLTKNWDRAANGYAQKHSFFPAWSETMSTKSRGTLTVFLIGMICICSRTTLVADPSSLNIVGPSYYLADQIDIQEAALTKDGKVRIKFQVMMETLWYCPGANAEITKDQIELTFVRAWWKKKPKVTHPAYVSKEGGVRVMIVDSKGKPVFLKSGKELVKIFPND